MIIYTIIGRMKMIGFPFVYPRHQKSFILDEIGLPHDYKDVYFKGRGFDLKNRNLPKKQTIKNKKNNQA